MDFRTPAQSISMISRLNSIVLFISLTNVLFVISISANGAVETIETITYEDSSGVQHEEYAFRAPMSGVPAHVIKMYCANVKLRLYWNVYRDEVKSPQRKGIFLRRMTRFAKHIYHDIRSVDRPFNATRLSVIDEYFAVKDPLDELPTDVGPDTSSDEMVTTPASTKPKGLVGKLSRKLSGGFKHHNNHAEADTENELNLDSLEQNGALVNSTSLSPKDTMKQIKKFVKRYASKFGMGIYTRWRTMWWLMMPCLFAKYYLWDPALDEFMKLQRDLVMYPDFQTTKLQDIDCQPIKLFQRILDVCKILNPLMRLDFGQFSLDKMTRFKKDT